MSTAAMHPLAIDYLRRLREAGRELPAGRLEDLCAEIESHLVEAIPPGASDAEALSVIERLGRPEEIVEAEQAPLAPPGERPRGGAEWAAIILLPLGGFLFGIGWLAGLILLWTSRAWTVRDKLIGTLIVPGGIASIIPLTLIVATKTRTVCSGTATQVSPTYAPATTHCVTIGGPSTLHHVLQIALVVVVLIGPIITAVYLARRAGSAGTR